MQSIRATATAIFYYDADGNGQIDAGESPFPASLNVTAEQKVRLIVRQLVPPGAPHSATEKITLTPSFTYVNATPALMALTPTTWT